MSTNKGVDEKDKVGCTPEVAKLLVENGADLNTPDSDRELAIELAIEIAARYGHTEKDINKAGDKDKENNIPREESKRNLFQRIYIKW